MRVACTGDFGAQQAGNVRAPCARDQAGSHRFSHSHELAFERAANGFLQALVRHSDARFVSAPAETTRSIVPRVVIIDDGTLQDVARAVGEPGIEVTFVSPSEISSLSLPPGSIVISSGSRALEIARGPAGARSVARVAVIDNRSRTTRNALRRAGIDYLVCRPVHPEALRLFFSRLLYRGPERRTTGRIAIGVRVTYRSGLRRRAATLIEASPTGCRVLTPVPLPHKSVVKLFLPEAESDEKFSLRGRVVRVVAADAAAGTPAWNEVGITFERVDAVVRAKLDALLRHHGVGPERWPEPIESPDSGAPRNRRRADRHAFPRRVVALGDDVARVLMARDVSMNALRIEPCSALAPGQTLSLALHGGSETPIVIRAQVLRLDRGGERVLRFVDLDAATREKLEKLIASQPEIESLQPAAAGGTRRIVTEIVSGG